MFLFHREWKKKTGRMKDIHYGLCVYYFVGGPNKASLRINTTWCAVLWLWFVHENDNGRKSKLKWKDWTDGTILNSLFVFYFCSFCSQKIKKIERNVFYRQLLWLHSMTDVFEGPRPRIHAWCSLVKLYKRRKEQQNKSSRNCAEWSILCETCARQAKMHNDNRTPHFEGEKFIIPHSQIISIANHDFTFIFL